jgi:hypothetical protein
VTTKHCKTCDTVKPVTDFRIVTCASGLRILRARCRGCENDSATLRWRLAHIPRALSSLDPYPDYLEKGRYGLAPEYLRIASAKAPPSGVDIPIGLQ